MGTILFELALTFYFASTIISIVELFKGSRESSRLMLFITGGGFLIHTASLIYRYSEAGHLPISSMHEASSFFAWCVVLIFFLLEFRYKIGIMSSFVLPIVFLLMLSSSILPRGIRPLNPVLESYWFGIHTFLAFLGNAAFAVAFGIGIMYLLQEHYLKSKHVHGLFQRLPSLQMLDEINNKMINLGFPLLTCAIITGALWAESAWGSYWRWDPKEVWSMIAWFIYALILHIRFTSGWRGRKAAILSIIGFVVVLFTFFGVNLSLKSLHSFR
ncbi:MAG: c-type cytochrome biogenesis protein CcsB [Alphaproteobacteria bacterium]|uniref:C-type cytochrome biogenesis protein CcsB n=1 Tax=Candidatus Nitrobium versatile TaxID=2884831 RepID=A0A953J5K3_9BACT|nr:c-type cytochrome biogenesis protein CcsB [Candidatus Nitrobium versatile]